MDRLLYISTLEHVMKVILCSCVFSIHKIEYVNNYNARAILHIMCMFEKCKSPSMGHISALTKAKMFICDLKL